MKFWVIHAQEPPPQPSHIESRRLWRSNTIAELLAQRGHDVVRWRSGFSHYEKRYLVEGSPTATFEQHEFQYLSGPAYSKNIGFERIRHHEAIARDFAELAQSPHQRPDLIHVCNVPFELCEEAVRFGKRNDVPVVIDIRDLWPDLFLDIIPSALKPLRMLAKVALRSSYRSAEYAMQHATAISGITEPFVEWGLRLGRRKRGPADRVFHMSYPDSHAVDHSSGIEALKSKLHLQGGEFIACYFGNIGHQSDFETLLEAAGLLTDFAPARIIICGDGPRLAALKQKARNLRNLIFPGWLQSHEIHQLMRIAAIGILPFKERDNYTLNMPNKFSEYLSGGLAIACGVRGEMSKLVTAWNCGFNYPTGNAKSLADSIRTLGMSPDAVAGMKARSRDLFNAEFNYATVYGALCDYLEGLAAGARKKD